MVTHDLREAFTLATRVIVFDRLRNRPEERERYGATITNDIAIWPPRVAGRQTIYDADISAEQDDLTRLVLSTGTTRTDRGAHP